MEALPLIQGMEEPPKLEIPLHTVMKITYDGWNPPSEERFILGPDPLEALAGGDDEFRVRGVDGLRVIDAAIMPILPSANTFASTIAIAEKGADMVLGRRPLQ